MENLTNIIFKEPKKTFMEILKVNNREIPFANILAYFFRPAESHGLNTIFLDALLETKCTIIADNSTKETIQNIIEYDKNSVSVEVEEPTKNGKRIDLMIVTNSFVICIEFKINHFLNNPLQEYEDHVNLKYKDKKKLYFVLTPVAKNPIDKAKEYFKEKYEFKQIILQHFISSVKAKIVEENMQAKLDNKFNYFRDFIQTVENREIRSKRHNYLENLREYLKTENVISEFKSNMKGGYLEIEKNNFSLKIRFTSNGIQIEKWNNKSKEIVYEPNKILDYYKLVEIIKTSR